MENKDAPTPTVHADLAAVLTDLAQWLDGMSRFMAVSKREWTNATVADHLVSQRLRKHTLSLRRNVAALGLRLAADENSGATK